MSETTAHDDSRTGPRMTWNGLDVSNDPKVGSWREIRDAHDVLHEDGGQVVLRCSESFELEELAKDMDHSFDELCQVMRETARGGSTERYMLTLAKEESLSDLERESTAVGKFIGALQNAEICRTISGHDGDGERDGYVKANIWPKHMSEAERIAEEHGFELVEGSMDGRLFEPVDNE